MLWQQLRVGMHGSTSRVPLTRPLLGFFACLGQDIARKRDSLQHMRDERIRKVVTLLGATIEYATQASASFAADLSGDVAPLERQLEALSYVLCVCTQYAWVPDTAPAGVLWLTHRLAWQV